MSRARADTPAIARSLSILGMIAADQGDFATAGERDAEARALLRERGDPLTLAVMLNDEGWRAYLAGDGARALALLEESLALFRQVRDTTPQIVYTLESLGWVLLDRDDYARARALLTEGLLLAQQHGDKSQQMWALEGLAMLAARSIMAQGSPLEGAQRAARLFGAAEALRETRGEQFSPAERSVHQRYVVMGHAQMDEVAWQAAWTEERTMPLEQAVAYALEDPPGG